MPGSVVRGVMELGGPGRWIFGLTVYYLLALRWSQQRYSVADFRMLAPHIAQGGGGRIPLRRCADDAGLVFRVIREAIDDGGVALNCVAAEELLSDETREGIAGQFDGNAGAGHPASFEAARPVTWGQDWEVWESISSSSGYSARIFSTLSFTSSSMSIISVSPT